AGGALPEPVRRLERQAFPRLVPAGRGRRSYTWVKNRLQEAGVVKKAPGRGKHRKRRARAAWPGMMLHQDASRHEWVTGRHWDLVVSMDDVTNEHYSMFFVEEEGAAFVPWIGGNLDDILCEQ
ncbi:hypothetical protein V6E02_09125, partial [Thiobacter sp. AK1]